MKKIILTFLLFLNIVNIANAIPVPALVIGGDFILLAIPFIITIFSTIYFYFRKYIFWINIYLLLLSIVLYYIHSYITDEIFINNYEYLYFLLIIILLGFIYKFSKIKFLNYMLVLILIGINFFLIKVDSNLYEFKQIYNKVEKNMYLNIEITNVLYKDNFLAIYYTDTETKRSAYTIIGKGKEVSHCTKKAKYNICNSGNKWLSKGISNIVYNIIE